MIYAFLKSRYLGEPLSDPAPANPQELRPLLPNQPANSLEQNDASPNQPKESVWEICQRLQSSVATSDDITDLMAAFIRDNGTLRAIWQSYSYRWPDLGFFVLDKLETVGMELAKENTPLWALHELFKGCEQYLENAKRYECYDSGSYNHSVRLIQSFAARQWCFQARLLDKTAEGADDSLFLYHGSSRSRSATNYALQGIEDLKPVTTSDAVDFMFETHDAVRAALGQHANQIMTLKDFESVLGDRGWQALSHLVDNFLQERLPVFPHTDPTSQAVLLLKEAETLPKGLKKVLEAEKELPQLVANLKKGFAAVQQLASATTPTGTAAALETLTQAAVMLAGVRPRAERRTIKVIGEDERVFALGILLRSSPHMHMAAKNAVMAYICTPYVGGDVDQSRAQSVFVAIGEWMKR